MRVGDREVPYSLVTSATATSRPIIAGMPATDPIVLNEWAARELAAATVTPARWSTMWEDPGRLVTRTAAFGRGRRADRRPAIAIWRRRIPASAIRRRSTTGTRRFRSTCGGSVRWTRRTGSGTARRRKRSSRSTTGQQPLAVAIRRADLACASSPPGAVARRARRASRARCAAHSTRWPPASRCATCAPRASARHAAPPTSARTSSTSASSSSCRRCCWPRCSSSWASSSACARSACCAPSASARRRAAPVPAARGCCSRSPAVPSGMLGAIGYAWLLMSALRTWWVDAVGTEALALHVSGVSLAAGAVGGDRRRVGCIWWTLRSLSRVSERSLLAGRASTTADDAPGRPCRQARVRRIRLDPPGRALPRRSRSRRCSCRGAAGVDRRAGAFFGAGPRCSARRSALVSALLQAPAAARARRARLARGVASRLPQRDYRPGRSVLSMAVIASATFILIAVDAFRRDGDGVDRRSSIRHGRLRAHRRNAAADRARPEHARGARGAHLVDLDDASRSSRSPAARRRCELPEPVRAAEPAHHRAA